MKNIIINGLNIGKNSTLTGVERFNREVIYRLDSLIKDCDFKAYFLYNPKFDNVIVEPQKLKFIVPIKCTYKSLFSKLICLKKIAKEYNALICSFALDTCLNKNQISCIHDMRPIYWKSDSFRFRFKYKLYLFIQKFYASKILTVSEYSKKQIIKFFHIKNDNKVEAVYNGCDHVFNVDADYSYFDKHPELKRKEYYYALGSIAPHKNFAWIVNQAKLNPNQLFVIAGGKIDTWNRYSETSKLKNMYFLGYVTDEENKALMENCKAFIHPSKYEGFGVPPLEALCCGAKIFLSNATCLPEIYGNCASYFDPDDLNYNIEEHLNDKVDKADDLIKKYSWDNVAKKILDILIETIN